MLSDPFSKDITQTEEKIKSFHLYKIYQSIHYLKKAKRVLDNLDLITHKVHADFDEINKFCYEQIKIIKKEMQHEP